MRLYLGGRVGGEWRWRRYPVVGLEVSGGEAAVLLSAGLREVAGGAAGSAGKVAVGFSWGTCNHKGHQHSRRAVQGHAGPWRHRH